MLPLDSLHQTVFLLPDSLHSVPLQGPLSHPALTMLLSDLLPDLPNSHPDLTELPELHSPLHNMAHPDSPNPLALMEPQLDRPNLPARMVPQPGLLNLPAHMVPQPGPLSLLPHTAPRPGLPNPLPHTVPHPGPLSLLLPIMPQPGLPNLPAHSPDNRSHLSPMVLPVHLNPQATTVPHPTKPSTDTLTSFPPIPMLPHPAAAMTAGPGLLSRLAHILLHPDPMELHPAATSSLLLNMVFPDTERKPPLRIR